MSNNGKGSKPRPYSVKYSTYSENWDNIFRKKPIKSKKKDEKNESRNRSG
jgi:hypothetical protein